MNDLAEFESTSVAPPLVLSVPRTTIRYGGILDEQGTSSGLVLGIYTVDPTRTLPLGASLSAGAASSLEELRSLTGFTWDQVARVLGVTARTPYLWTHGRAISRSNEEKLQRLVAVLQRVSRGSADANRAALLGSRSDGTVPFDLLASGDFERAERVLSSRASSPIPVSAQTLRDRRPISPVDRMSLSDEKVHSDSGVVRTAHTVRVKKRD